MTAAGVPVWCQGCTAAHPHDSVDGHIVCTGCGLLTPVTPGLLGTAASVMRIVDLAEPVPVVAWELCDWCNVMVRTPHACPASGPTCPTTAGHPCGICDPCIAAQAASMARPMADVLHGSPSDLDHP